MKVGNQAPGLRKQSTLDFKKRPQTFEATKILADVPEDENYENCYQLKEHVENPKELGARTQFMVQRSRTQKECLADSYTVNELVAGNNMIIEEQEQENYNSSTVFKKKP